MRRRFLGFLAAFVFLGFNLVCFAQESQPQAEGTESLSASSATQEKLVTAIEVKGNKATSTNAVISKMKTKVGSPYQANVISDDLKRLYLLGFFSDIKIDSEDYKDGIKVIVTVVERPIIEKISFAGITALNMKDEKLKTLLKSKEGQYLDYPSLTEDVHTLKKMYEKIGYAQVLINYETEPNKENGKVKVQFNVVENKRIRIKDIIVQGNASVPTRRILKLIKARKAWLFNAGALKEDELKEDMERIKAFYRKEGFIDVTADYEVKPDAKKPFLLHITIKIQEGKKYLVGTVTVDGNQDISRKAILEQLKECIPGKVYSEEALKQDVANIQSLYFDRGYISVRVDDTTALNQQTGRVDIAYRIVENEIAFVDKIKIRGNVKTKDVVIRRELRIRPGDKFDGDKLRRSKERLQNLGFFEEISYDTEDTQEADKKNLVVEVKESKTGSFSFGGGYSTVDQLVGFAEIEQKNFDWKNFPYFTGDGQNLKFRASFGQLSSGFDLSFTDPWIFDYPISFGFDAYKQDHKREEDVGYGYDQDVIGGDLRLGREISEYWKTDLTYRNDHIKITNITENASHDLKEEAGTNTISSITPSLTFDSRDNVLDPKRGNLLTGALEWAGGGLGGSKDFWKFYGRASHYFPMPKNSVLEVRGRIGIGDTYSDTERIPIYERFFAGGAYTIRGYEERSVGPVDPISKDPLGGDAMLIGNVEYTYPLFDFLKVAAFYDVGNVWAKADDLGSEGFKSGIGLGIRVKSPIGPIMLDYGFPLNKAPGEEKQKGGRFHFSASQGF